MPIGPLSDTAVATPLVAQPVVAPPPATCEKVVPTTLRMQFRPVSAMYTVPAASTATSLGDDRLTVVAAPVVGQPVVAPPPATRVTLPAGSTLRMQAAPVSAMYTLPAESTATPRGAFRP